MDLKLDKLPWYGQVGIFVVLGLALIGGFYWFYAVPAWEEMATREQKLATLRVGVAKGQATANQLNQFRQQVAQFEARRVQLQQRVTLIEELRKGQSGPVHLLDQISKSLPESMWLTDLKQAANEITMEGRCTSMNALSDFVSALEASNLFERPVEIVDSQVEPPATAGLPELIRFSVRAKVATRETAAVVPAKAGN